MDEEFRSELEILVGIVRTRNRDGKVISARTVIGELNLATFVGLVSTEKRFIIPRAERVSIARELKRHDFLDWDFYRLDENGVPIRHGPFSLTF